MMNKALSVLFRTFGTDIQVSFGSDGLLFNGHSTPHNALLENDLYRELDFATQMIICAAVSMNVNPLEFEEIPDADNFDTYFEYLDEDDDPFDLSEGRTFLYTYQWHANAQDYSCTVLDQRTGRLVFDEWYSELQRHHIMETVEDVEGLAKYLVKHGELLNGDAIIYEEAHHDDDDDEEDLES
jgi:hypothetical protein